MPVRVSVVTPFYNTGQYLEECIQSVLAQSFKDFEYILVNNCSTDNSLAIAQKYADADSRIRLFSNDRFLNQVQNYNRSLALVSQESRYCKMVQADDWIYKHCLEEMVALADTDARIGIVSSYRLAGRQVKEVGLDCRESVLPGRAVCRKQLLEACHFFGSPSTLLFRSDIVRSRRPFYAEGRLHEDTEACYEILEDCDFGFVHQVLSFSRTENDSIMSSTRRFNPALLDKLIIVRKYGRNCLDPDEFAACWRSHESRYLRYLAESALRFRGRDFWDYHIKGLATAGYRLSSIRLAAQLVLVVIDLVLNPKHTMTRALRAFR